MTDFEVHPIGTANRLAELEAMLTAQTEPVRREDLLVGDRVRIVSEGVLTAFDERGEVWGGEEDLYYLIDRPDPEPETVDDEALVKVVVDSLRDPRCLSSSDEDYARDLVRRLYAKAVQS